MDKLLKLQNDYIYNTGWSGYGGPFDGGYKHGSEEAELARIGMEKRLDALFGPNRKLLEQHSAADPVLAEILIADAVRTGHWQELPEPLRFEYCRRMDERGVHVAPEKGVES